MTFCQACDDSGEIESIAKDRRGLSTMLDCDHCPTCIQCNTLISESAFPGVIGADWYCSPECGATMFGGESLLHSSPAELLEAAHCLEIQGRSLNTEDELRDYRFLAHVISRLALGQVSRADYLKGYSDESAKWKARNENLPGHLRAIVEQGGAN